ncbi:MAG: hypothetical protein ACK53L_27045, partial [Pirellulaceae bacterium]
MRIRFSILIRLGYSTSLDVSSRPSGLDRRLPFHYRAPTIASITMITQFTLSPQAALVFAAGRGRPSKLP